MVFGWLSKRLKRIVAPASRDSSTFSVISPTAERHQQPSQSSSREVAEVSSSVTAHVVPDAELPGSVPTSPSLDELSCFYSQGEEDSSVSRLSGSLTQAGFSIHAPHRGTAAPPGVQVHADIEVSTALPAPVAEAATTNSTRISSRMQRRCDSFSSVCSWISYSGMPASWEALANRLAEVDHQHLFQTGVRAFRHNDPVLSLPAWVGLVDRVKAVFLNVRMVASCKGLPRPVVLCITRFAVEMQLPDLFAQDTISFTKSDDDDRVSAVWDTNFLLDRPFMNTISDLGDRPLWLLATWQEIQDCPSHDFGRISGASCQREGRKSTSSQDSSLEVLHWWQSMDR